ncbi:MAG: DEAD/DEAH box helicase [Pseudohongiellaceae bacterium]
MRNNIPAHYNVFDQFDRSIVSIDTLKRDSQIRAAIESSYWDLVIIDEAHNAADRSKNSGKTAQRAKLAQLLSSRADSLLLLTATPHDGSQESFASLIKMLDPTRVPDAESLKREDIEDLVVRRFRSSPEVIASINEKSLARVLHRRDFSLTPPEEAVYDGIADLELDLDEESRGAKAIDLFRTTLAKAIFSSPIACGETLRGRIQRIENGTARGTDEDKHKLQHLLSLVEAVDTSQFSKYTELLTLFKELSWTGKQPRDRFVIFSERIATVSWLEERLKADLNLSDDQIGRVDGGSVDADERTQQILEDFGQERSSLRILICSDMASEGLNLHFQCHRLIHFDLPWSLLRFQQRNGRIDRYGQDRHPQIYYFVAGSTHPKIRQMWVLDKLVEKDEAARQGVGDPAVFLGGGDVEHEEATTAEFIAHGKGSKAFEALMEENQAEAKKHHADNDAFDLLFGDYTPDAATVAQQAEGNVASPPRLFSDPFTYATKMLAKLGDPALDVFQRPPQIDSAKRHIHFPIPDDMYAQDVLGYAKGRQIDDRFMPVEAVTNSGEIELTDDHQLINHAIEQAKSEEHAWPKLQYLWEGHSIFQWFAEQADTFFPDHSAPIARLPGRLEPDEVVVIIHGSVPNQRGAPVVDRWLAIGVQGEDIQIEEVNDFIERACLDEDTPGKPIDSPDEYKSAVQAAVRRFQDELVTIRKEKAAAIDKHLDDVLGKLSDLEGKTVEQLTLQFAEQPGETKLRASARQKRLERRKQEVSDLFEQWRSWFEETQQMVDDPNPYVDVRAVLVG